MRICSMTMTGNAAQLARAILSTAPHVDAHVLLDTGVTDDTLESLRGLPGRKALHLGRYQWKDDFGDARNHLCALARHQGFDWGVLVDSDEWLTWPEVPRWDLRRMLGGVAAADFQGFTFPHASGTYGQPRVLHLPLLGAFDGRVHEALSVVGRRLELEGAAFHDAPKTAEEMHVKWTRDLRILNEVLGARSPTPETQRWWFYKAESLAGLGRIPAALSAYDKASEGGGWAEEAAWAAYRAASLAHRLEDDDGAIQRCQRALDLFPGMGEVWWFLAFLRNHAGDHVAAIAAAHSAIALGEYRGIARLLGRTGFRDRMGLNELPYDVLRFAYAAIGCHGQAAEAAKYWRLAYQARTGQSPSGTETAPVKPEPTAPPEPTIDVEVIE